MTNEQAQQALNDWLETLKREHGKEIHFVISYPPVVPLLLAQAGIQETAPPAVTVAFGDVAGWVGTVKEVESEGLFEKNNPNHVSTGSESTQAIPSVDNGRYKVAPPP